MTRVCPSGYHWKLNGKWLYLHGYGDDSIYPMFTSPPLNHSFYKERLEFSHGVMLHLYCAADSDCGGLDCLRSL
eukprot:COSAG02_NODE_19_length_53976_cov_37.338512_25_plen_74_part_00